MSPPGSSPFPDPQSQKSNRAGNEKGRTMNPLIQLRKAVPLIHVAIGFGFVGALSAVQAVVPPPDGGYPNFTTAEGQNALKNLSSGAGNTAIGWYSLFGDTNANYNTGIGAGTLVLNNADANTATGTAALLLNTSGFQNTANGALALLHNDTGSDNTATGFQALFQNTIGANNTATGVNAMGSNTQGSGNTAMGNLALGFNSTGGSNTAVGVGALLHNTTNSDNTAVGSLALGNNTGSNNTAVGSGALMNNTTGINNTADGDGALQSNTSGFNNTAFGRHALFSNGMFNNIVGQQNTAVGGGALGSNVNGSDNTAVGFTALSNSTGDGNIAIGNVAGNQVTTASSVICIGALGANVNFSCYIDNIWNQPGGSQAVFVNSDGKLGAQVSSRRFKKDIKPMGETSEALYTLKPVSFHYKKQIDPAGTSQFGLVAEDVEKVNPDLVVRDKEGNPYSVRYDQVNAMVLNEFLKEHATVQELKKEISSLKADLQEVRDHLQMADPCKWPRIASKP